MSDLNACRLLLRSILSVLEERLPRRLESPVAEPAAARPATEEVVDMLICYIPDTQTADIDLRKAEAIRRVRAWEKARVLATRIRVTLDCAERDLPDAAKKSYWLAGELLALLDGEHEGGT